MCRSVNDPGGQRRCSRTEGQKQMGRIMQMFNRHTRSLIAAEEANDQEKVDHYGGLLADSGDKEDVLRESAARHERGESWAERFTPSTTARMTTQQMRELANANAGDVDMYDRLNSLAAARDGLPEPEPAKRETPALPEPPTPPAQPPSRASEFTLESTRDMSEDRLRVILATEATRDPAMQDAITTVLSERAKHDETLRADIEAGREDEAAWENSFSYRTSNLTAYRPSRSPRRHLTAEQQCREEYTLYCHNQYLRAENDCRGALLNERGRANNVDPATLFSGPAHVANAYASDELRTWFRTNGRAPYVKFRSDMLGRDSDYKAAQFTTTYAGFSDAA